MNGMMLQDWLNCAAVQEFDERVARLASRTQDQELDPRLLAREEERLMDQLVPTILTTPLFGEE